MPYLFKLYLFSFSETSLNLKQKEMKLLFDDILHSPQHPFAQYIYDVMGTTYHHIY